MYTTSGHYIVFLLGTDTDWDKWATLRIDKNIGSRMFEDCCSAVLQQQEKNIENIYCYQWYLIWKMRLNCARIKSSWRFHKSVYIHYFFFLNASQTIFLNQQYSPQLFLIVIMSHFLYRKTVCNILLYLILYIYSHCADNECGCNKDDISN